MKYITRFYFTIRVLSYYPTRELPFNINIGKDKKTLTTGINRSPMMPVANEDPKKCWNTEDTCNSTILPMFQQMILYYNLVLKLFQNLLKLYGIRCPANHKQIITRRSIELPLCFIPESQFGFWNSQAYLLAFSFLQTYPLKAF